MSLIVPESLTETDPVFSAAPASGIAAGDITNWDTAYGWGNHAAAGYLDDYEEGTWTPTFSSTGATFLYDYQIGRYTKIGNTVIAHCRISLTTTSGGTAGNNVSVDGLPFTVAAAISSAEWGNSGAVSRAENFAANTPFAIKANVGNTNAFMVNRATVGGGTSNVIYSDMATGITILFTLTYQAQ